MDINGDQKTKDNYENYNATFNSYYTCTPCSTGKTDMSNHNSFYNNRLKADDIASSNSSQTSDANTLIPDKISVISENRNFISDSEQVISKASFNSPGAATQYQNTLFNEGNYVAPSYDKNLHLVLRLLRESKELLTAQQVQLKEMNNKIEDLSRKVEKISNKLEAGHFSSIPITGSTNKRGQIFHPPDPNVDMKNEIFVQMNNTRKDESLQFENIKSKREADEMEKLKEAEMRVAEEMKLKAALEEKRKNILDQLVYKSPAKATIFHNDITEKRIGLFDD